MNQPQPVTQASWADVLRGRNGAIATALTGGVCLHAINIYLATTLLPTVVADIGGIELYAWSTTLFILASIASAALTPKCLERGVHWSFRVAALLLLAGSIAAALAPSMHWLLLGRTLQGAGGGLYLALGYAMVTRVFPEHLWSRALALISGMWGVATLLGPAVGGLFAQWQAWRWAFAVMIPALLIYQWYCERILPAQSRTAEAEPLALRQLGCLIFAVLAVSMASLIELAIWQWLGVASALLASGLLVVLERCRPERLFPAATFSRGSVLLAVFALVFSLLLSVSMDIYLPYFLQRLHAMTPLQAGYCIALLSVGWVLAEIASAGFTGLRAALVVLAAPVLVLAGLVAIGWGIGQASPTGLDTGILAAGLLLMGLAIGGCWPHLNTLLFRQTPEQEHDKVAAAMTTVLMYGSALGAALAGLIANALGFSEQLDVLALAALGEQLLLAFVALALLGLPAGWVCYRVMLR